MNPNTLYPVDRIRAYCEQCVVHLGVPPADAATLVDVLLEADMRGKGSHGILRLPHYCDRLRNGTTNARPRMRFDDRTPAASILYADDALGHVAAVRAMEHAVQRAKTSGVSAVAVVESSHFGFAGYYSEVAAREGALGLAMTHTDTNTVPFGAKAPYFGSNALSFSAPTGLEYPVTIDFCCAKISYGKIYDAKARGVQLPEQSALDAHGRWTRDPNEAEYLCSAAEHKGFGLAMMIEILCAMLTGIPFCRHITSMYDEMDKPPKLGHFLFAIDVAHFSDLEAFKTNMHRMIAEIHALPPADGVDHPRVHGEQSHRNKQRSMAEGIAIHPAVLSELVDLGEEAGLAFP